MQTDSVLSCTFYIPADDVTMSWIGGKFWLITLVGWVIWIGGQWGTTDYQLNYCRLKLLPIIQIILKFKLYLYLNSI